jgi:hypothetical protein
LARAAASTGGISSSMRWHASSSSCIDARDGNDGMDWKDEDEDDEADEDDDGIFVVLALAANAVLKIDPVCGAVPFAAVALV